MIKGVGAQILDLAMRRHMAVISKWHNCGASNIMVSPRRVICRMDDSLCISGNGVVFSREKSKERTQNSWVNPERSYACAAATELAHLIRRRTAATAVRQEQSSGGSI